MKLRNKKTGEIKEIPDGFICNIRQLCEEWEDYENPKGSALDLMILTLTNFIENEPDEDKVDLEDCRQMLEKLKAWKRLKDKGFRFLSNKTIGEYGSISYSLTYPATICEDKDLDLLFGGEE